MATEIDRTGVKIADMPADDRPREKMLRHGPENLTNAELLAILMRTGSAGRSAVDMANELLCRSGGLRGLFGCPLDELTRVRGIGKAKALEIISCAQLGRRYASEEYIRQPMTDPETVYGYVKPEMSVLPEERFYVLLLDNRNQLIGRREVSRGTADASMAAPRDVFRQAIREGAVSVILVHNHPSGDPSPSADDRAVTRRLVEAGVLLGIKVLDHVVVGAAGFVSFARSGLMPVGGDHGRS